MTSKEMKSSVKIDGCCRRRAGESRREMGIK